MMDLGIGDVCYLEYVGVGSGQVKFSHGILDVPTPATRRILEMHNIPWRNTPAGTEAATPTGAAILAGCGATPGKPGDGKSAMASGTRPLPPVTFYLDA
jgi:uncharacterized protein (DUF111 family)